MSIINTALMNVDPERAKKLLIKLIRALFEDSDDNDATDEEMPKKRRGFGKTNGSDETAGHFKSGSRWLKAGPPKDSDKSKRYALRSRNKLAGKQSAGAVCRYIKKYGCISLKQLEEWLHNDGGLNQCYHTKYKHAEGLIAGLERQEYVREVTFDESKKLIAARQQ